MNVDFWLLKKVLNILNLSYLWREKITRKTTMKKLTILIILTLFSVISRLNAQSVKTLPNSFEIVQNTLISKEDFYKHSILEANLENYRLKTQRVLLSFENGFVVELLSAEELHSKNNSIDVNSYQSEFPKNYLLPVFTVLPNGSLVATYHKWNKN
ncbi:MAG: hypothetical protein C0448_02690 [Sphingobacteriaceae bacterium]|nr:hypothetical protein [Sphingobacteriaceae bacterium]